MLDDLDVDEWAVFERATDIKKLWLRKPVANDPEWHEAILRLIQALDGAIITEDETHE